MTIPLLFVERIYKDFPSHRAASILDNLLFSKKQESFRVNREKITFQDLENLVSDPTRRYLSSKDGILSTGHKKLYSKNPLIFGGIYYFQSHASTLPVRILDPSPGEGVLDACASPGSKSTQILGHLKGTGFLVANEIDRTRIGRLVQNISEWGAKNVWISQRDTSQFSCFSQFFDKVLIDAPCSGEGTFYKDSQALEFWNPKKAEQCAKIQKSLLRNLLPTLKVGGELVYSTCTLSIEENEEIVQWVLEQYGEAVELVSFSHLWEGGVLGVHLNGPHGEEISQKTRRILPYHEEFEGEGFFLAKFRICQPIPSSFSSPKRRVSEYSKILDLSTKTLKVFFDEMGWDTLLDKKSLLNLGHSLCYHPRWERAFLSFMIESLHPIYVGCRLGTDKGKWILPTYEWVLQKEWVKPESLVDLNEEEIRLYLLGVPQKLASNFGQTGFVPISYKRIPLGIGKILKEGTLKSYFSPTAGKKIYSS